MRFGDRAALFVVAVLAMWVCIIGDPLGWIALWYFHLVTFDLWTVLVSVFPIAIDLIILRVALVQAAQTAQVLDALLALVRVIEALLRSQHQRTEELHDDVDDVKDALGIEDPEEAEVDA